jgi:hypothetical protein
MDPLLSGDSVNSDRCYQTATIGVQQWKRNVSTWSLPRCHKQRKKSVDRHFYTGGYEESN